MFSFAFVDQTPTFLFAKRMAVGSNECTWLKFFPLPEVYGWFQLICALPIFVYVAHVMCVAIQTHFCFHEKKKKNWLISRIENGRRVYATFLRTLVNKDVPCQASIDAETAPVHGKGGSKSPNQFVGIPHLGKSFQGSHSVDWRKCLFQIEEIRVTWDIVNVCENTGQCLETKKGIECANAWCKAKLHGSPGSIFSDPIVESRLQQPLVDPKKIIIQIDPSVVGWKDTKPFTLVQNKYLRIAPGLRNLTRIEANINQQQQGNPWVTGWKDILQISWWDLLRTCMDQEVRIYKRQSWLLRGCPSRSDNSIERRSNPLQRTFDEIQNTNRFLANHF